MTRKGLRSFLESFPDLVIVGEAASGEEALQQMEDWLPDVVIMDLLFQPGTVAAGLVDESGKPLKSKTKAKKAKGTKRSGVKESKSTDLASLWTSNSTNNNGQDNEHEAGRSDEEPTALF